MDDISWSALSGDKLESYVIYVARELTRWEWMKVHVLRRRDPRVVARGQGA